MSPEEAVEEAIASAEMDGYQTSDETRERLMDFVRRGNSAQEAVDEIMRGFRATSREEIPPAR